VSTLVRGLFLMDFIDWYIACQHWLSRIYFVKHRIQVDGCRSAYNEAPTRLMTFYTYICWLHYVTYVCGEKWCMSKLLHRCLCLWDWYVLRVYFILFFGKPPLSSVCACKWNMYYSICLCAHTTSHDANMRERCLLESRFFVSLPVSRLENKTALLRSKHNVMSYESQKLLLLLNAEKVTFYVLEFSKLRNVGRFSTDNPALYLRR
jgi:hypothetical protein